MPHPEREHALQIELATALRERDAAREDTAYFKASYARKLEDEKRALDAAEVTMVERDELEEALAAARRECEGLRTALSDLIQEMNFGGGCDGTDPSCDGCIAVAEARKALAAPAAAAGEEGT